MHTHKIDNWEVTKEGITWLGERAYGYDIGADALNWSSEDPEGITVFAWLLHIAKKPWVSDSDVYAFNEAFLKAFELSGTKMSSKASYQESLRVQKLYRPSLSNLQNLN